MMRPSMRSRHYFSAAALSLGASLALTGCFAGEAAAPEESDDRVSIAMLQPPRSGLNPLTDDAFKLSRWNTAETLVVLDENGDAQPKLATEWERSGDLDWTFTLREGVKFHDGTELTAASVVKSLQAAMEAAPKPRILDGVDLQIEANGDYSVNITTAVPDPLLAQRLSSPQLAILAEAAYSADGAVTPLNTGSGPFKITNIDGASTATLDRYEEYWGEKAVLAGIDVAYVGDGTARAAALRTGTADVIEAIPVSQAPLLDQELVHEVPMPRTNTLYLNNEKGVFADPGLRAAVREAVDPTSIVSNVYEGRADEAQGLLGPALPWAAENRQDVSSVTEPVKATGQTITLGTFTDRAELPEVAVLIEQQLEAAGFVVEQDVREYANIEQDMLAGAFDIVILSRATVLDSGDPVAYMFSDFSCEGSFNIGQVCDPEIDEALRVASESPAGDDRRQAIMAAEALILQKNVAVPLLHERVIQGEAASVTDVVRDPRERALITVETTKE
jgi:peptide/nickel transport system substrate-binding protein